MCIVVHVMDIPLYLGSSRYASCGYINTPITFNRHPSCTKDLKPATDVLTMKLIDLPESTILFSVTSRRGMARRVT